MKNIIRPIVGVMGPGNPNNPQIEKQAELLGQHIADNQWILLTGGRNTGVMNSASKGANKAGGTVIGILPGKTEEEMSDFVTLPIKTGMGNARNAINILSSDVIVVCGMGSGTASEAALAIKHNRPLLFTMITQEQLSFFNSLGRESFYFSNDIEFLIEKINSYL